MSDAYRAFLESKSQLSGDFGFAPTFMPDCLFDFQRTLVDWTVRKGRAAIFADCGMGKTVMQLTWAQNVVEHSNKPVLVLAPLAVALQTVEEADKFGFSVERSLYGGFTDDIVVTNYERLHHFNPHDFGGVVCDESSIMKNFDGARRHEITEFMRKTKHRLLCTATAAPNDYVELGTSSEALGYLGHMDMLGMFFKNNEDSLHPAWVGSQWRFKHHAERDFWRWICSWARACRRPSDIGFDDGEFVLPRMQEVEHVVASPAQDGALFPMRAVTLEEQRAERKATIRDRCERAAELLSHDDFGVAWCQLNAEADLLAEMIDGAKQISGSDDDEVKEELLRAFRAGELKKLVTKPSIAAFGQNWQHCNHMTFFPDHSFEKYYQATRRLWRFGQQRPVRVDNIISESNVGVSQNLRRKADACEKMFAAMVAQMADAMSVSRFKDHINEQELPAWL